MKSEQQSEIFKQLDALRELFQEVRKSDDHHKIERTRQAIRKLRAYVWQIPYDGTVTIMKRIIEPPPEVQEDWKGLETTLLMRGMRVC